MNIIEIERAIIKRYRAKLYRPFVKAVNDYDLVKDGDKIAVCMSGGKDSFVLAKLFQEMKRHGKVAFDVKFLVMNPGFNEINLVTLKKNAETLGIPIQIKDSDIFRVAYEYGKGQPCYLCAKMRRGFLYDFAKEQGCNKIALGHHFDDIIETTLLNVLSSLLSFEGEVNFDGNLYSKLKENNKEQLRSQRIGFIFQDYKLFEFDTTVSIKVLLRKRIV